MGVLENSPIIKPSQRKLDSLKKRQDYLAARSGRRWVTPGFIMQVKPRPDQPQALRIGLTVSAKVGKAVERNRVKRRLRALSRNLLVEQAKRGHDIVLIARAAARTRPYRMLESDLKWALQKMGLNKEERA